MKNLCTFLSGVALASLSMGPVLAAGGAPEAVELAPHRAVYDLALISADEGSQIIAIDGRYVMSAEDVCDGYAINERMVLQQFFIGEAFMSTEYRGSSYEAKDGSTFRFSFTLNYDDTAVVPTAGRAIRTAEGVRAEFRKPQKDNALLPKGVLYPMAHLESIIQAAKTGEDRHEAEIFDGDSENTVFQAIARISEGDDGTGVEPSDAALAGLKSWPISIAFFVPETEAAEPYYSVSMRLYENGVATDLAMDYGDFVMSAALSSLEFGQSGC